MEKEMVASTSEVDMASQDTSQHQSKKGGLITMPFIIANESLAKVASSGLTPNMILYMMGSYNLHMEEATQILLLTQALGNFTPVAAAFIADSYIGRFLGVGLASIITFLGITLLWLTAMLPQARPPPCETAAGSCTMPTSGQLAMLISSHVLMSIGNGGISLSLAFGANQVDRKDNPNNQRVLETFFNWYYASSAISIIIAFTGIVYIQDHLGWKIGFGVPAALMFFSTLFFFIASPLYVNIEPRGSLITVFARVCVAAYKNRNLTLPPNSSAGIYHHNNKDSGLLVPTDKLRFLNKACITKDPEKDIDSDGSAKNPWNLCTVDEVEELKAIPKVIPLWSSSIMMSLSMGGSFGLLQAKSLNRHITSHFEVPAGSFSVILIITIFIWIVLYDRLIIPLVSMLRGKQVMISAKTRIGLGMFFYFLNFVVSAMVEAMRRRRAIEKGYIDNPEAVLDMSALWLFPQLILGGIGEAFNAIGQNEFYYTEFPKSMSGIASSLLGLGMGAGSLVSSLVFSIVGDVTSKGGKEGWISDNINRGHYDRYYWVIATLSGLNILYYLVCSWAYGPTADQVSKVSDEIDSNDGESHVSESRRKLLSG